MKSSENYNLRNAISTSKLIIDAFSNSTSHSLPKIIKSKFLLIKFIWIVSSILSISFCSYTITSTVNEYLKHDVVSNIRVHTEIEADYPAILFCNRNPIVKEEGRQMFLNYLKQMNVTDYEENLELNKNLGYIGDMFEKTMTYIFTNLTNEQKKKMGYSIEEMVLFCQFNYVECEDYSEFVWFYDAEYGNCYKFNTGFNSVGNPIPLRRINGHGRRSGLNLAFFIGTENNKEPLNIYEHSQGK
jgi:hypothetical protein